mmetsp:Transcript_25754/g.41380  ORF Transcript_25754/g.41380 Transcript_25754/m.41380 type:complete len:177 (+) Transcript_25754:1099-1629(+)
MLYCPHIGRVSKQSSSTKTAGNQTCWEYCEYELLSGNTSLLYVVIVGDKYQAGAMSNRRSGKISKSEGDLNSVNSFVTTRSKYTVKSGIEMRNGKPINSRNKGGIPFNNRGEGIAGSEGYFKRKRKLLNREKIEKAKKKAVMKCIKNSFQSDSFKRQLAFWAEVDKTPFEELLLEV